MEKKAEPARKLQEEVADSVDVWCSSSPMVNTAERTIEKAMRSINKKQHEMSKILLEMKNGDDCSF